MAAAKPHGRASPANAAQALLIQATEAHRRSDFPHAEAAYRRVVALDARNHIALHFLGLLMTQTRRGEEAVGLINRALKIKPDYLEALNSRGAALLGLGRGEEALASFDRALALNERFADALVNRGFALKSLRRLEDALQAFDAALAVAPGRAEAHLHRAATLIAVQRPDEAVLAIDRALAISPNSFEALYTRGQALHGCGRFAEALGAWSRALTLQPARPEAHCRRSETLRAVHRPEEALASYRKALALDPACAEAAEAAGAICLALGRIEEALADFDRAIVFAPECVALLNARANALQDLGRYAEALATYDRALQFDPGAGSLWHNRGNACTQLSRFEEARASYDRALAIEPNDHAARAKRGLLSLLTGDFAAGWADYESRWLAVDAPPRLLRHAAPVWRGEAIAGKSIVVYDEQGLGDVIQFCRYVKLLSRRGADVTFLVRPSLVALVQTLDAALRVTAQPPEGEDFDFQCPLMSLPLAFATTLQTIPGEAPYLAADAARAAKWRERLGPEGFKIGVAWRGSEGGRRLGRSFALASLAGLCAIPGVRLISLQKGGGVEELERLPGGVTVETLGEEFDSGGDAFLDSAAVMRSLDLFIGPDSALAHLAGALACPAWIALPERASWRWSVDGADCPWYPTLRLFRQERSGDWRRVMAEIEAALRERLGA